MSDRRVVLFAEDASRDAIDDAFAELALRMVNVVPRSPETPEQVLTVRPGGRTSVALITDDRLGCRYAVADGEEAAHVAAELARRVGAAAPGRTLRLALAALGGTLEEPA